MLAVFSEVLFNPWGLGLLLQDKQAHTNSHDMQEVCDIFGVWHQVGKASRVSMNIKNGTANPRWIPMNSNGLKNPSNCSTESCVNCVCRRGNHWAKILPQEQKSMSVFQVTLHLHRTSVYCQTSETTKPLSPNQNIPGPVPFQCLLEQSFCSLHIAELCGIPQAALSGLSEIFRACPRPKPSKQQGQRTLHPCSSLLPH